MALTALLGPQRLGPTVAGVLARFGIEGAVAVVTAGWQELEEADQELGDHLGGRIRNLRLHARTDQVFEEDPELAISYRARQDRVRALQVLHRVRLGHSLAAARELLARSDGSPDLARQQQLAVKQVAGLDAEHLEALRSIGVEWASEMGIAERPGTRRHRAEVEAILDGTAALAIAGGHVVVLLNRLRLFGVLEAWGDRPVVAWSGGAMVLAERLFAYHDSPPQGPGNAEVLEAGLGRVTGLQPFPDARRRLRLDDTVRTVLLAGRTAPRRAVLLDDGEWIALEGTDVVDVVGARLLGSDGSVGPLIETSGT
jgi:hypothetical protein